MNNHELILNYSTDTDSSRQKNPNYVQRILSAPETVHLAVTYRCGENCPDCYSRKHNEIVKHELNTSDICGIIDILADNGVFQLAIGGGEPFARVDLADIVKYAAGKDLTVHVTTGKYGLKPQWTDVLKHIKSLHIGIRSEELIYDTARVMEKLRESVKIVCDSGISIGVNLIITRFTIRNLTKLIEILLECGFKRLIFLRYKPITDYVRWINENPGKEDLKLFKNLLTRIKRQYPHVMIRIDCASVFLLRRDMDSLTAVRYGMKGCTAGDRIISVAPDGAVYPCSQLVGDGLSAGNLMSDSFRTIWRESAVLDKYRNFRQNASFENGVCGHCDANIFCGGCRIFADDVLGSESFCPIENIL